MSDIPDPTRIEHELDETRSRLGSHLNELQDKFSPGQVLDDLMGYFRGSEGAEFGRSLLENVRGNPMPAAITAIGLAWLMSSKNTGSPASLTPATATSKLGTTSSHVYGQDNYSATMARVREAEQAAPRGPAEAEQVYSERLDEVRGQAIGLARHVQETTESFGQRVKEALASVQDAVVGSAHDLRDQVGTAANAAGNTAGAVSASAQSIAQNAIRSVSGALSQGGQASGNLVGAFTESPVLLGALGLAAGALLGALLPQTGQEEAALGGIASQARDAATSLAQGAMESGKQVAQTVIDKGRDSLQARGLTSNSPGELIDAALSGNLASSAKTVIQDVVKTGDEALQKEVAQIPKPSV
jgi:hypothetical protein